VKRAIFCSIALLMFCGNAQAAKYSLSDDEQKFLMAILSQTQIRGADAPMLLQCANALQRPVVESKETPKVEPKPEAKG